LADVARYHTLEVQPDRPGSDKDSVAIDVVYCSTCGVSLHMFVQ